MPKIYLNKTCLLLVLLSLFSFLNTQAQPGNCGDVQVCFPDNPSISPIDSSANAAAYANYYDAPIEIPVVVHILHDPADNVIGQGSNVSNEAIEETLALTNMALSGFYDDVASVNTNFQLCLATKNPIGLTDSSIRRHSAPIYHNYIADESPQSNYASMHEFYTPWNTFNYMNIWIVKDITGFIALAYGPDSHGRETDRIVIEASQMNIESGARVLAHEIGHYFGLIHSSTLPLPENNCPELDCTLDGDKVCDTPANISGGINCTYQHYDCSGNLYIPDDFMNDGDFNCFKRFTQGQKDRMRAYLIGYRPSLIESPGCSEVFANDASIWKINGIDEYSCTPNANPSILIANSGYNTLTSLQISYGTDPNNLSVYNWTGNIASGDYTSIDLAAFNLVDGEQEYYVSLDAPNGFADAEYSNNELSQTAFYSNTIESFFFEDMEASFSEEIYIENPDNREAWEIADIANCSNNGNKALKLKNWEYNNMGTEDIFTLKVNLDAFDEPYLFFEYAYSELSPFQSEQLLVMVQQECGGYYTNVLFDKHGNLPTTDPPYNSYTPFTPESCDDWEEALIPLTYLKDNLSGNIYISFKSINDNGNNLYIDNIIVGDGEVNICPAPAPTNLFSQVQGGNNVLLTWEGNPNADHYTIEATTNGTDWILYDTVYGFINTSYTLESLVFNEEYEVRIAAVCTNGETSYAYTSFINYYDNCSSPDTIWVTDLGDDFINIQFTLNNDINTYEIHFQEAFSTDVTIVTTNVETYTFENLNPNTQYNITIFSICEGVLSYDSAYTSVQTTGDSSCDAPTNLTINDIDETSALIDFDPVPGALQYVVIVNGANVGNVNTNYFELNNLTIGEEYSVFVYAICFDGTNTNNGENSETVVFETVNTGCQFVETFDHDVISDTSIGINWEAATGAYYYIVEYRPANTYTNPNAGWSSSSTTVYPTNLTKVISLAECGEYEVRIKTICENGEVGDSEIIIINTCDIPECAAPYNLDDNDISAESALISWNGPNNAWVYDVQLVLVSNGFIVDNFLVMGSLSTLLENLLPDTEYCVNIRTYCLNGLSEYSTICFTTEICNPPTYLNATNITTNSVDFIWEDILGTNYDMLLINSNGNIILSGLSFNNYYSFNDLEPNTTYTFTVSSYCSPNFSETISITFTTEAEVCDPPEFTLQAAFPNNPAFVGLFFTPANTQDYMVTYYPTNDANSTISLSASGSSVFVPIENFTCTDYTFVVNSVCDGELSDETTIMYYEPDCEPDTICDPPSLIIQVPFDTNPQWVFLNFTPNNTSDYQISYQLVGSSSWEDEITLSGNDFISLDNCAEYIFYVYGICNGVLSDEATIVYYTPIGCDDGPTNCGNAFIESFGLNTLFNLSPTDEDYCYYDYTSFEAQVAPNSTYEVKFNPGGSSQGQYWRMWVDSNNDGQFNNQDLMIYEGLNDNPYNEFSTFVTMPNICGISTTLRVAMQTEDFGPPVLNANPIVSNGQMEDYTITFADCKTNSNINEATLFNIYPNPAQDQAFAHFEAITEDENSILMIYNTVGQIVQQQTITISRNTNTIELAIDQLSPGMYVVNLNTANKTYSHKLIVTE